MKSVDDVRHTNLLAAIDIAGSQIALAEKCDMSTAYVSQLVNKLPNKSGTPRTVGRSTARKIEIGLGLPEGWMDADHEQRSLPDAVIQFAVWFDSLSGEERERIRKIAEVVTEKPPPKILFSVTVPSAQDVVPIGVDRRSPPGAQKRSGQGGKSGRH